MSTHTIVPAAIISALVKAEEMIGDIRGWFAVNNTQHLFLDKFFSTREELSRYSETELRSWASWVADELNAILRDEGFSIQLDPFDADTFGVVSILDVLVEWIAEGKSGKLFYEGVEYPSVRMNPTAIVERNEELVFRVFSSPHHSHPIARLSTKSGDFVYMTIADEELSGFALHDRIDKIRGSLKRDYGRCSWLTFPMIDLDQNVDISWLLGLGTTGTTQPWTITQALQQTKFKMNEHGARVKSAVAIAVTRGFEPAKVGIEIDKPFFLWIEREGLLVPIMYAYFDTESWMDPGNLDL